MPPAMKRTILANMNVKLYFINLYSPFNMVETTTTKKHSQQTITLYDSGITCSEISSDDEQAGHSANQSKTLPDIEQQPIYHWF